MIGIIDYGLGNLNSIFIKMKKLGVAYTHISEPRQLEACDKFILPGVGHFANGMKNLRQNGFDIALHEQVIVAGKPILGICLGTQLFCLNSEEGNTKGLGWINARVVKFDKSQLPKRLKIPHIGWNTVDWKNNSAEHNNTENMYYFVHSYHLTDVEDSVVAGISNYGYDFVSAVKKNNIYGYQFHPEKSHSAGMGLLNKFITES